MKNMHILPTDKPSRLYKSEGTGELEILSNYSVSNEGSGINIYITSDEEIKEGDWFIANNGVHKCIRIDENTSCPFITLNSKGEEIGHFKTWRTKIILTTDQDLIKDGVQSIDEEFLEWFVNNPSCNAVIVTNLYGDYNPIEYFYEIIIPKEEPKQETLVQIDQNNPVTRGSTALVYKQETLEEAVKRICSNQDINYSGISTGSKYQEQETLLGKTMSKKDADKDSFEDVTKYKIERSYSEEEVHLILGSYSAHKVAFSHKYTYDMWFEQFKKK